MKQEKKYYDAIDCVNSDKECISSDSSSDKGQEEQLETPFEPHYSSPLQSIDEEQGL